MPTLTDEELAKKYGAGSHAGASDSDLTKKYGEATPDMNNDANTQFEADHKLDGGWLKRGAKAFGADVAGAAQGVAESFPGVKEIGDVSRGDWPSLVHHLTPGSGVVDKFNEIQGIGADDARRKAEGYSIPYRGAAAVAQGVGIADPNAMEAAAKKGDTAGVVGHTALPVIGAALGADSATGGHAVKAVGEGISSAREGIGKKIWEPPTPARNIDGVSVGAQPAPGKLTRGADMGARAVGFVGGGALGGAVGLPGYGEFGAGMLGQGVAPSMMERMFPEPKAWEEGRLKDRALNDQAESLEKRGKQQETLDAKAAREEKAKAREAKEAEKKAKALGGVPLLNENPKAINLPQIHGGEEAPTSATQAMPVGEGPHAFEPTSQAVGEAPAAAPAPFSKLPNRLTKAQQEQIHPKPFDQSSLLKDLPSTEENLDFGHKDLAPPKKAGKSAFAGTDEKFPNGFHADDETGSPNEGGIFSRLPTGKGSMPKAGKPAGIPAPEISTNGHKPGIALPAPPPEFEPTSQGGRSAVAEAKGVGHNIGGTAKPGQTVLRLPEASVPSGVNPANAGSIPRESLLKMAESGDKGAQEQLRNLGQKMIITPEELHGKRGGAVSFDENGNVKRDDGSGQPERRAEARPQYTYKPSEKATTMSAKPKDLGPEFREGEKAHELERNKAILRNPRATAEEKQIASARIRESQQ